ncbi:PREDICTED: RNA polymerase I-specific transcription initiation factor RRN3-like, partial [Elephantulus edwardii]|uniref:RNA polymerase I-specific transcription initiation factor RRN3-like n=1 Tax=Elephantulus edwardii TaxID=28737 RepID=UPI0003F0CB17
GFAEAFLEHLWKQLQDPNNPAIIRQAAGNHGPFYSACQAVFYTIVFRHKQLLSGSLKK